jgi:hypothetical protein
MANLAMASSLALVGGAAGPGWSGTLEDEELAAGLPGGAQRGRI